MTIQREAQLSDLITAIREETCQEHFYYDSGGNGCLHFKSNCPQCQIIKLMAEVEMWRLAHDTQVDAKLHQVSKCATLQEKVDRLEKENKQLLSDIETDSCGDCHIWGQARTEAAKEWLKYIEQEWCCDWGRMIHQSREWASKHFGIKEG